jgi:hypothetical protein
MNQIVTDDVEETGNWTSPLAASKRQPKKTDRTSTPLQRMASQHNWENFQLKGMAANLRAQAIKHPRLYEIFQTAIAAIEEEVQVNNREWDQFSLEYRTERAARNAAAKETK